MPSAPPRRDAADRRAQVLAVAVGLAEESGLDQLGAAAVATRAGVSKPLVFHYFGTAAGLRRAVALTAVEHAREALGAPPAGPADPAAAAAPLAAFLDAVVARRSTWQGIWQGALAGDAPTEAALADLRTGLVDRLTAAPRRADTPRARLLTSGWVALAEHLVAAWLAGGTDVSRDELEGLVLETFAQLAGALTRDGA
ncbi:TetR/AcrR family transcriptional regulator [Xylanimonas protaetiae]|uniref:TetR/AcrR family transcriptional regulator n=1 Tax=Xylanimonas protaetiae TaxID=2509457 RepID=A0A4P6F6A2_9MICO|nr:TetR/AcrR family transcriptional regulator [Xylanimonas protaetiae]QAY71164.1 TetR/AcrR family transcriptional regulator [Xylanimonas protaetiae]